MFVLWRKPIEWMMGNIRGDQGGLLGGGDIEAETWRMRTSRSSKKGRGWEKGRRGFQRDVPCLSPSTNPTFQSQGYAAHWSSCITLQPSLWQWEILPRGRKATSVSFGGELMSPAMCCRRRWQLFDLSLADIPPNQWRGSTKIDLKCIRRSPPAYVVYLGSRNCPDKRETMWQQNELLRNWKGLAKSVYRRWIQDKLPAWLLIYHTDQILFKTASVKYSMENQFQLLCKAKTKQNPTTTINYYNIL